MLLKLRLWWATNPICIKLKTWCHYSLTVGWAYFKIAVGVVLLSLHEIISIIQDLIVDPEVKSALNAMNFPAYVGLGLAIIGAITLMARLRKHSEQPVEG